MSDNYDYSALLRPKCKVCSSQLRQEVDLRLMGKETDDDGERLSYDQIVDWAAAHGLVISKAGLSRHKTDHLMPDVLGAIEAQRQVEAIAQATGQTLGMEQAFLNMVVNKAMRAIDGAELTSEKPEKWLGTVVRSIETLLKVKKTEMAFSKERLEAADKAITDKAKELNLSPEALAAIREQVYGIGGPA